MDRTPPPRRGVWAAGEAAPERGAAAEGLPLAGGSPGAARPPPGPTGAVTAAAGAGGGLLKLL